MRCTLLLLTALSAAHAMGQSGPMSLQDAITFARANSPMLKAARAEFLGALANERGAKAMLGPQVSVNGFTTTGNNTSILGSVPKTDPAVSMQVPPGQFSDGNLMFMLPILAGDVKAMAASAKWQSQAAAGDYREAETELELSVRQSYFVVKSMHEDVLAAQASYEALLEMLKTTKARFEAGKAIEASVQRVQAELSRAERDLKTAKNSEAKAYLDLLQVIGGKLDAQVQLLGLTEPEPKTFQIEELVKSAMANRGVLTANTARTKASEAELRAAKALSGPRLYATGMADATNRRDMGGVTLGLSMSFPLFDGGRVRSEIEKAKSMKARAEADLASAKLQVEKEVRQSLLDYETALENLKSATASAQAASSAFDVISVRVEAGKAILLEQLDALDLLTRARTDVAKARLDLLTAFARLSRSTGGDL
jgi:outer membrane protein